MEDQIRPVNDRGTLEIGELKRASMKVPGAILSWASTEDAVQKFNNVIERTGIYGAAFRPAEKEIVAIGEKKPVDRATILLSFIIDHQKDLSQIEQENRKIMKNIETKKSKIKSEAVEEVLVPKELLGIIIGKSGANLTYIKQEYGVSIHIVESEDDSRDYTDTEIPEDKALIRIYGNNKSWVKEAKAYICLSRNTYPIEANKIEYFRGYKNSIINDMKEKSGCVKVFIHEPEKGSKEGLMEAIGNEESLEALRLLMETHLEYFETYRNKENETRELSKQESKYNTYGDVFYDNSHKGDGRRRGKRGKN